MTTAKAAASPRLMDFGGRQLLMSPLTERDFGEFEDWMRAGPIRICKENFRRVPDLTQPEKDVLLKAAMEISSRLTITSAEGMQFMVSMEGAGYLIWLGLRKENKEITLGEVQKMLADQRVLQDSLDMFDTLNALDSKKGGRRRKAETIKAAAEKAAESLLNPNPSTKEGSTESSGIGMPGQAPASLPI